VARIPYAGEEGASAPAAALRDVRNRRGFVSNVHRSLAHWPEALAAYEQFSIQLDGTRRLDARTHELVILRVAQLLGNVFAWRRHVPRALAVGLSMGEVAALANWHESASFGGAERAVLELVDQHVGLGETETEAVGAVRAAYGDELLVEILVVVGLYAFAAAIIMPLDLAADDPDPPDLAVPFERVRISRAPASQR
jgi:4-carboxymuconolactone decarboxylase